MFWKDNKKVKTGWDICSKSLTVGNIKQRIPWRILEMGRPFFYLLMSYLCIYRPTTSQESGYYIHGVSVSVTSVIGLLLKQ